MHGMGQRVGEASPARLDAALRSMRSAHGANMARHAKTILHGALALAVMANVLGANPIRDVASIKSNKATKGATALTGDQLRELLAKLHTSDYCRDHDLVDPITVCPDRDRAAALGTAWPALVRLRYGRGHDHHHRQSHPGDRQGIDPHGRDQDGLRSSNPPLPRFAIEALTERRALRLIS